MIDTNNKDNSTAYGNDNKSNSNNSNINDMITVMKKWEKNIKVTITVFHQKENEMETI